jgi:hypothetical protein
LPSNLPDFAEQTTSLCWANDGTLPGNLHHFAGQLQMRGQSPQLFVFDYSDGHRLKGDLQVVFLYLELDLIHFVHIPSIAAALSARSLAICEPCRTAYAKSPSSFWMLR